MLIGGVRLLVVGWRHWVCHACLRLQRGNDNVSSVGQLPGVLRHLPLRILRVRGDSAAGVPWDVSGFDRCHCSQWWLSLQLAWCALVSQRQHLRCGLLRLFPFPYPDSIPDQLPYPERPPRPLSMTNRTPKTSSPKILRRYPYRSPKLCLSI